MPIRKGDGTGVGSIRLGDGTGIAEVRKGDGTVVFSTDTTATVATDPVIWGSASYDTAVNRWQSGTGVTDTVSDTNGDYVAINDGATVYVGSGSDVHAITDPNTYDGVVFSNSASLTSLAVSKNYIFTGDANNNIKKWDTSGTELWSVTKSSGDITALSAGSNGDLIAGDSSTAYYIESDGTERWSVSMPNTVSGAAYYDSDHTYVCGQAGTTNVGIRKLDNFNGTEIWSVGTNCNTVSVHANDEVVGDYNGEIFRYTSDGTERWRVTDGGFNPVAFPNGASVSWNSSNGSVRHYDETGSLVYSSSVSGYYEGTAGLDGTYGVQQW